MHPTKYTNMDNNNMDSHVFFFFRINIRNKEKKLDAKTSNDNKQAYWYSGPEVASLATATFEVIKRATSRAIRIGLKTRFLTRSVKSTWHSINLITHGGSTRRIRVMGVGFPLNAVFVGGHSGF